MSVQLVPDDAIYEFFELSPSEQAGWLAEQDATEAGGQLTDLQEHTKSQLCSLQIQYETIMQDLQAAREARDTAEKQLASLQKIHDQQQASLAAAVTKLETKNGPPPAMMSAGMTLQEAMAARDTADSQLALLQKMHSQQQASMAAKQSELEAAQAASDDAAAQLVALQFTDDHRQASAAKRLSDLEVSWWSSSSSSSSSGPPSSLSSGPPSSSASCVPSLGAMSEDEEELKRQREEQRGRDQDRLLEAISGDLGFYAGRPIAALVIFRTALQLKAFQADSTPLFDRVINTMGQQRNVKPASSPCASCERSPSAFAKLFGRVGFGSAPSDPMDEALVRSSCMCSFWQVLPSLRV